MKKIVFIALVASCFAIQASFLEMHWGLDHNYARYDFDSIAKQSGYLAGFHFDFSYKNPRRIYTGVHFDGRWNAGNVCSDKPDLCNSSCLTGGCLLASVADYLVDWQLGYYYMNDDECFSFKPYAGVGFQHLSYLIDPSVMRYKYYQVYVPVGVEFLYHSPRNFSIGTDIAYRAGVYNRLKVSTPCVSDDCNSTCDEKIKLKYSQGFSFKIPIELEYRVEKRVGFQLSCIPFFDWNKFNNTCDTNSDCIVFPIPESKRWYLGVTAALGIIF